MFFQTTDIRDSEMNSLSYDRDRISEKYRIIANIKGINQQLDCHPICSVLTSSSRIKALILYHIFDAWDTNKLIRPLQNKIDVASFEKSSRYHHELKKLLEETILNRPAGLYPYGEQYPFVVSSRRFGNLRLPSKHNEDFANYLHAIAEVDIDLDFYLRYFLKAQNNLDKLKPGIKTLVQFNSSVALRGTRSQMIAVLLLGKKQLDLRVFKKIVLVLTQQGKECPLLLAYIEKLRQNQSFQSQLPVFKLLNYFCQDEAEQIRALQTGLKALYFRKQLWNYALAEIRKLE